MGSGQRKAAEAENEKIYESGKIYLISLSNRINTINPHSTEFTDRVWIEENKDKILRNKTFINQQGD